MSAKIRRRSPALYDYDAAAELTGYQPSTVRAYCDNGRLRAGLDFVIRVYRFGRGYRRVRLLTRFGVARLMQGTKPSRHSVQIAS